MFEILPSFCLFVWSGFFFFFCLSWCPLCLVSENLHKIISIAVYCLVIFYLVWFHPWTVACRWAFRTDYSRTWHHKYTGSVCNGSRCTCGRLWVLVLDTCRAPGMACNNYHNDYGTMEGKHPWWSSDKASQSQQFAPKIKNERDCFAVNKRKWGHIGFVFKKGANWALKKQRQDRWHRWKSIEQYFAMERYYVEERVTGTWSGAKVWETK